MYYRTLTITVILTIISFMCASRVNAQSVDLAKDLYTHNLIDRALESFIEILHDPGGTESDRAESLYYMGQISFERGDYSAALNNWRRLANEYPSSPYAEEINSRLAQLREVFGEVSDAAITSTVAQSYIRNGDFWSGASKRFTIDSSWMPVIDLALHWYDTAISDLEDTNAAENAYQRKLFTILGWAEPGRHGSSYGLRDDFGKYIPMLTDTFGEFEASFPDSPYLQGFRYQIAQAYWREKDWENTRQWLNKIIDNGEGDSTFYTEAAKARLENLEY